MTTAAAVLARSIRIDRDAIQKLRKDFLQLSKNIPRVRDYKQASELREAFKVFRNRFNRIYFDEFVNQQLKYDDSISEHLRDWHERKLRKTGWDFYLALNEMPLDRPHKYNENFTEEGAFQQYQRASKKWDAKLKRIARELWKVLDDFLSEIGREHYDVPITNVDQVEVEGFQVRVIGDIEGEYAGSWERFRAGLRIFRKRAGKVFPPMLRMMLPIHAKVVGKLDEGGRYERRYIEVSLTAGERPEMLAKILAHEMGHHIYKVYLGQKDRTFWDTAIRGNYGPIDIDKALRLWPDGAWIHEMGELLKDVDPTLAIQLELLGFGHGEVREIRKKEDFEAAVARGDTFAVPQNPVTGYAGKNPEEAFCEALGMLIGYGPRTVDPLIRHWVQMILPNLRVAGLRIAKRGGIDRTIQKAALGRSLLSAQVVASFEFSPMRRHCERPYMQMREGPESRGQSCLGQGNSSSVWWPMIDAKTVVARYKAKRESDKGNTIYLYSERQVALRNNKKAERIAKLGKALKKLRAQVKRDLKSSDPETKLTALAVALMDHTYERVGNDESASEGHFGVTGWQRRHVSFKSDGALIRYTGKSGVKHEKRVTDAGIRKALREAYNSLEGDDTCVLSWDDGCVTAEKVNAYLEPFGATAKDIRGYHANDEVRSSLRQTRTKGGPLPKDKAKKAEQLKKEFKDAVELAAAKVGHEPTTLNSQYLIPGLEDTYLKDGKIL